MPKIGQNCMKKWPFFAIFLPWMASYGPKRSFLLIFSARDDLVKVSWKSDAGKCPNQVTPPYFDQLSERYQLLLEMKKRILWISLVAMYVVSIPNRWSLLFIFGSLVGSSYFTIQATEKGSAAMYYHVCEFSVIFNCFMHFFLAITKVYLSIALADICRNFWWQWKSVAKLVSAK